MSDKPTNNAPEFAASSLEAWAKAAAKSAPGGDVSALNWVTPDGITVKPLYTAEDTASLPYANTPCLLYTSPSPRDVEESRMPSSA